MSNYMFLMFCNPFSIDFFCHNVLVGRKNRIDLDFKINPTNHSTIHQTQDVYTLLPRISSERESGLKLDKNLKSEPIWTRTPFIFIIKALIG